jgi:glutamine cyclotransferase
VELASGDVLQIRKLPDHLWGEGITIFDERIIQLIWQSGVGFVYDKDSFELLEEFSYPTEGWGITHDGKRLIMSNGTSTLHCLDPETFEETGRIEVCDQDGPVTRLNELEYVQGEIYANVWQTDRIARIAPDTGEVTGWIELVGILSPEDRGEPVDVLNGIAYDAENDRLFVTGKLWPRLFEIELVPLE